MFRAIAIISLALALLTAPISVCADEWADFNDYLDRYYFIDDHEFEKIICSVEVETLNQLLDYVFRNVGNQAGVVIQENLSDFQVVFDRQLGLSFQKPSIRVSVPQHQDKSRNEQKQKGARMIEEGFDRSVYGTVMVLEGLFESYIRPKRPGFSLQSFAIGPEKVKFGYMQKDQNFQVQCGENQCARKVSTGVMNVESTEKYEFRNRKYFLRSTRGVLSDSMQTITTTINVDYINVGGVELPASITGSSQLRSASTTMDGKIKIMLKNCQIE